MVKKSNKRVMITLNAEFYDYLRAYCKRHRTSLSKITKYSLEERTKYETKNYVIVNGKLYSKDEVIGIIKAIKEKKGN